MKAYVDEAALIPYDLTEGCTPVHAAPLRNLIPRNPPVADPALAADQMRLLMISEAQQRGLTWRQIASALGYASGPEAKRAAHRLARKVQAAMLAQEVARG